MSESEFSRYESLRQEGHSPAEVYRRASADGVDQIGCFRLLRQVFDLSLVEAKRVIVKVDTGADSLEEHQETLLPGLEKATEDLDKS